MGAFLKNGCPAWSIEVASYLKRAAVAYRTMNYAHAQDSTSQPQCRVGCNAATMQAWTAIGRDRAMRSKRAKNDPPLPRRNGSSDAAITSHLG